MEEGIRERLDLDCNCSESILLMRVEKPVQCIKLLTGEDETMALEICNLLSDSLSLVLTEGGYSKFKMVLFFIKRVKNLSWKKGVIK